MYTSSSLRPLFDMIIDSDPLVLTIDEMKKDGIRI